MLMKLLILCYLLLGGAFQIWFDRYHSVSKSFAKTMAKRWEPRWIIFGVVTLWIWSIIIWPYLCFLFVYDRAIIQKDYWKFRSEMKAKGDNNLPLFYWGLEDYNRSIYKIVTSDIPPEDTSFKWKSTINDMVYEYDGRNWVRENYNVWKCSPGKHDKCNCKQPHDCWYRDRVV